MSDVNTTYYYNQHTWIKIYQGCALFGITAEGVQALGPVAYIDLPFPGDQVHQAQRYGKLYGIERCVELVFPVSGQVREINTKLLDDPALVQRDPLGEGWLVQIQLCDFCKDKEQLKTQPPQATEQTSQCPTGPEYLGRLFYPHRSEPCRVSVEQAGFRLTLKSDGRPMSLPFEQAIPSYCGDGRTLAFTWPAPLELALYIYEPAVYFNLLEVAPLSLRKQLKRARQQTAKAQRILGFGLVLFLLALLLLGLYCWGGF